MTGRVCTCAGTAPGYPQHESFCGQPEPADDEYDLRLAYEHAVPPGDPEAAQRIRAGSYDVQEDKETGYCTACGCTVWSDADLCEYCDCDNHYRRLAGIHAERTPAFYPQRPGPWHDSASSATGPDSKAVTS